MFSRTVCIAVCVALTAALAALPPVSSVAKPAREPVPRITIPQRKLDKSVSCNGRLAKTHRSPVLLVPGTFATAKVNWSWNYKKTLPTRGEVACTVDLPDVGAGDIQQSTEYIVSAIRTMAKRSDHRVAAMGQSQGGLEIRWALRWWPDIRHDVSDVIMLATPNHGAEYSNQHCTDANVCSASLYQMRSDSNFLAKLNGHRQAIGHVPYTAIVTTADHVFVLPDQGRLDGPASQVSNIAVQDVCPDDEIDHQGLAYDGPTYAIVRDALNHPGPARASRLGPSACRRVTMPGTTLDQAQAVVSSYLATLAQLLGPDGPKAPGEPKLACYAEPGCRHGHPSRLSSG
jgi:triacylglycerol lipase